ncbi:MAG: helix-hairpin-helix domain-containing protein [Ginsengibacter sp.]
MDIHGMNSFKSKSLSIAAYKIDRFEHQLSDVPLEKISLVEGIGESTGKLISELLRTNKISALEEIILKTPEGILEMMKIKGIGPKKISIIWKEMEIESLGELLYACNENRLSKFKGFGKKTQDNVIESIEFYQSQKGNYLYAQLEQLSDQLIQLFTKILGIKNIAVTGDFRRQNETIDVLEFVVALPVNIIENKMVSQEDFKVVFSDKNSIELKYDNRLRIKIFSTEEEAFGSTLFKTTGDISFIESFEKRFAEVAGSFKNEKDLFQQANIQFIEPCLRESPEILTLAADQQIPTLIQPEDIKGIIHCHSDWSDGANTIEEMIKAAMELGLEYLVISDHSKAAFYANGLTEERIAAQHVQIDKLNLKYPGFKIFKSIECDILSDGSLDYEHLFLHNFDLVITSVHSNLKMNEEKAMSRLIKAIENPHTTILGHMTGRLLLSRKGYPVDYKKIIDACSANKVVIEINAHPKRLDMRWQWIHYALNKEVLLSINPDAHSTIEFGHLKYGVLAAQKGMLTKDQNLSSFSRVAFEAYLKQLNKH